MKRVILTVLILLMITFVNKCRLRFNTNTVVTISEVVITAERISPNLLEKQRWVESLNSHFKDGEIITSKAGAIGISQFMPSTWSYLQKIGIIPSELSIFKEEDQKIAQKLYMLYLWNKDYKIVYNKNVLALASYNAGYGRVTRLIRKYGVNWLDHAPKETRKYIKIIIG